MAQVHHAGLTTVEDAGPPGRWSAQRALDVRAWDGEYVVRSEETGQTFLLSSVAGNALQAIRGGATALPEIAAHVLGNDETRGAVTTRLVNTFADVRFASQSLIEALHQLEAIGLTRRADIP